MRLFGVVAQTSSSNKASGWQRGEFSYVVWWRAPSKCVLSCVAQRSVGEGFSVVICWQGSCWREGVNEVLCPVEKEVLGRCCVYCVGKA